MAASRLRRAAVGVGAIVLLAGVVTACTSTSVLDLSVGDCIDSEDLAGDSVSDVVTVPCDEPHDAEIFAELELPEGDYPGIDEVRAAAEDFCLPELEEFVGTPLLESDLDVYPLLPTADSWTADDDRLILCIVVAPEDVTGTLEGSER
jgi:hypothetical protein